MSRNGKVIVAMSGGVDSSVAAALLKEQGYDCIGVFLRVGAEPPEVEACAVRLKAHEGVLSEPTTCVVGSDRNQPRSGAARSRRLKHGCCSANDALDARLIAGRLGIPFYALNFKSDFDRIIDYFVDEYAAARTPNPCVMCNIHVKFGRLFKYADLMDAPYIATGHYARIVQHVAPVLSSERASNGASDTPTITTSHLARARNLAKDQSYVLFGIRRSDLRRCIFPLGEIADKADVRRMAAELGLHTHDKPDSQEICFVPDNDYAALVRERRPGVVVSGPVCDETGRVLAQHDGVANFTIGQRRGLGFAVGKPLYVTRLDVLTNTVTVGGRDDLLHSGLVADSLNWLSDVPAGPVPCTVKIRHMHEPAAGVLLPTSPTTAQVTFDQPQSAVTPGQAAVFYAGDLVLGGGWISRAL